jgi:hypothetical protein
MHIIICAIFTIHGVINASQPYGFKVRPISPNRGETLGYIKMNDPKFSDDPQFSYTYRIEEHFSNPDSSMKSGLLHYTNININYNNKNYKNVLLKIHSITSEDSKNAFSVLVYFSDTNTFTTSDIISKEFKELNFEKIFKDHLVGRFNLQQFVIKRSLKPWKKLTDMDRKVYNEGMFIINEILPKKPWYKRYFGYMLAALGICVGTYCYMKYKQK